MKVYWIARRQQRPGRSCNLGLLQCASWLAFWIWLFCSGLFRSIQTFLGCSFSSSARLQAMLCTPRNQRRTDRNHRRTQTSQRLRLEMTSNAKLKCNQMWIGPYNWPSWSSGHRLIACHRIFGHGAGHSTVGATIFHSGQYWVLDLHRSS